MDILFEDKGILEIEKILKGYFEDPVIIEFYERMSIGREQVLLEKAELLLRQGRYDEAIEAYKHVFPTNNVAVLEEIALSLIQIYSLHTRNYAKAFELSKIILDHLRYAPVKENIKKKMAFDVLSILLRILSELRWAAL